MLLIGVEEQEPVGNRVSAQVERALKNQISSWPWADYPGFCPVRLMLIA